MRWRQTTLSLSPLSRFERDFWFQLALASEREVQGFRAFFIFDARDADERRVRIVS